MKIPYVENGNGKLFSFSRHDYKDDTDKDGNYVMIVGFGSGYLRYSGELKHDEIGNILPFIREKFIWGKNLDKNGNILPKTEYVKLKDLGTDHIINILSYFNNFAYNILEENNKAEISKEFFTKQEIFVQELKFRYEQGKY